uniref:Uncharacterized protein n=1 Tax=Avena sativa TaxID=4498 RepID=A0ACD5ZBI6_AVESA
MGHKSVVFTTQTNDDGSVRIASKEGGFWKRSSDDWILTGNVEDKNDPDALFEAVTGDGFVALRNLGNKKFCKRVDGYGKPNCLRACDDTISQYARFKLVEPVFSQEIYDVQFYLNEARIYNNGAITMESDVRTNESREVQTGTFSFTKKTGAVSTWETTVSSKTAVSEKFSANIGQTPMVLGKEVTLSSESTSSHRDTDSTHNSEERTVTQNLTIYPGEKVEAKFVATRASCDVPFSYKQKIVLTTGDVVVTVHNDGIYTGVNTYDFHITLTRSKISKVYDINNSYEEEHG